MSRWKTFGVLTVLTALVVGWPASSDARPFRPGQLPNGSVNGCANCHVNPAGGGTRNAFGREVESNFLTASGFSGQVIWNAKLAQLDSDGDGVPNGTELADPDGDGTVDATLPVTNPGDPADFAQTVQPPPSTGGGDGGTQPPVDGPISVVSFTLGGVTLEEDVKNPVLAVGPQEGVFTFSQPLDVTFDSDGDPDFGNLEFVALPPSLLDRASLPRVSDDGLTLTATFDLPEGETYQLITGDSDALSIEDLQQFFFGTTDLSDATVSGKALLPEDIGEVRIEEEGIALLLDPEILLEIFFGEEGDHDGDRAGKVARLKRAAKTALLQQQPSEGQFEPFQEGDGREGEQGGGDGGEDGGLGEFIRPAVRLTALDGDLGFELDYVPDGEYVVAIVLDARTLDGPVSLFALRGINEHAESEADFFQDLVVVSGGQSVSELIVQLQEDLEEVFIEAVSIARVEPENDLFFIRGPDDRPVSVDVSGAELYTADGGFLDIDDFLPGDVVQIFGLVGNDGIRALEVIGLQRQAQPKVTGLVLDVQIQDGRGRIDLTGPSFSFNANTRVVSSRGGALSTRDLRPGNQLVIFAQEAQEMGRPPVAVEVRVQSAGSPLPPSDSESGLFVGELGSVNFDNSRFTLRVSFGFNRDTRLIDRDGNALELSALVKGVRVQVTALPTDVGTAFARTVTVLRGAGELVVERITEAVFVTPEGNLSIDRAFAVPLSAEIRLRFDVPLTDATKDLVEIYVYEPSEEDGEDGGEDVDVITEVVGGELKATMTLQRDTFYEVFAAVDEGNEIFGIFTTALALPTLQAVSSSPANGDANVSVQTTLSVTLNQPVGSEGSDVFAHIEILPRPLSGEIEPEDLTLSDDGMTLSVAVVLEPNRNYLAALVEAYDVNGFELDHIYKAHFSTGVAVPQGKVTGNFVLPPGHVLDPVLRNGIGFVGLISADLDFENLDGDEDQLGTAFDVTRSGAFSIEGVPAGRYVVESVVFFESGGNAGEGLGLVGSHVDQNGDQIIIEVGDGAEISGIDVKLNSELDLRASTPPPGKGGVGSGRQRLALEFSEPLQQHRGQLALDVEMIPPIEGFDPREHLRINRDNPREIEAQVNLQPDTDYVLLVLWAQGVSGAELDDVIEIPFSTRERFLGGSIAGSITLSDGSTAKGKVTLGNLRDQKRVGEVTIRRDGTFQFQNVPPGAYGVFLSLQLADGRQMGSSLDSDGNGEPDVLTLEAEGLISDLAIAVTVPTAPTPSVPGVGGNNASALLAFDFDSATGNGGVTTKQVTAGEAFSVGVYANGVTNLIGYEVVVTYDAEKVALKSVLEQTSAEGANILKNDGGLGAFIGRVGTGTATLTAVILGPSEKVAPEGDGLLGVLQFEALDGFKGETGLAVQSAVLTDVNSVSDSLRSSVTGLISSVELTKSIGLTILPSIIDASGSDAATVTAQVLDLSGVLQSDDNSSVVTFATSGGSLTATTATAVNGVATTTIFSNIAGTITVTASASGAVDQTAKVVAQATSTEVPTGPAGPVALDLDLTPGDQGTRQSSTTPKSGDIVEIDLVAVSGALDALGVNVVLSFDSNVLTFKGFAASDIFTGGLPITVPGSGSVQISLALLGTTATKDAGSIGTVSFTVASGFSGSASVVLTSAEYGTSSGTQSLSIGAGGATVLFGGGAGSGPSPDLNGDGTVGFPDFLIFAQAFGKNSGDAGYVAKADLDSNGNIGFSDFLVFAQSFGKDV
ncbi:MAG: hypothetical protein ACI8V2_001167 [Candidatus Latescibacterota bacterium]|jgi:hypothetical protein